MTSSKTINTSIRDLVAFWIFGLANNYAYVVMLSAASDIIARQETSLPHSPQAGHTNASTQQGHCEERILVKTCHHLPTGAVLLADILPALLIKLTFPFFMQRIPFGLRHFVVCSLQAISYLVVSFSNSIYVSLIGVAAASLGSGLGEICYLGLSAHYSKSTISAWSSGTGGAGIIGAMAYAVLTEPKLAGLTPSTALLSMLIVPVVFGITYWFVLTRSPTVHTMKLLQVDTWLVPKPLNVHNKHIPECIDSMNNSTISKKAHLEDENRKIAQPETLSFAAKLRIIAVKHYNLFSLKFTIMQMFSPFALHDPLSLVYYAEYLINQGIVETIYFDCSHGFSLSKASQYRWYQVLYQVGVFISRSSVNLIELPSWALYILPVLQMVNALVFFFDSIYNYIPHIALIFSLILVEGLFGGASYVNTFNLVHKEALPHVREFSLSITSLSDSLGIVFSALSSIPVHSYICDVPARNSHYY
uniref:Battenin n=1 Tax=Ditylenchus dipsaci TaxID=166011 RepID=A0A915CMG6_9BILA